MHDRLRQTGRTTRMLEYAIAEAHRGEYVSVYAAHARHQFTLLQQLETVLRAHGLPLVHRGREKRVIGHGSVTIEIPPPDFDWTTLRSPGTFPSVVSLVDHYTIECHWPALVAALHHWDTDAPPPPLL